MKRIVNGVTYNTDTSTIVARFEREADNYNPESTTQWLYQTRGNAFFIHRHDEWHIKGEGGWETRSVDSFHPMTYDEAYKWVLKGDIEIFGDVFPEPPEAEAEEKPKATIYVRVPQSLKGRIDEAAANAKLSVNAWAMRCLETCLNSAGAEQEEVDQLEAERPTE